MLTRQMLLAFEPKLSPEFQGQIKNAHGTLVDEINRKAAKPVPALALLALTVSNPPTQAQVQAIATKVDAVIAALNA